MSQTAAIQPLRLDDVKLYVATAALVLGNVLLPYALHALPQGGQMFLPLFFFTLVAGWRFGGKAGLLTGVLSPLANHFLTGMPPAAVLQSLMLQSAVLGVLAAVVASRAARPTLALLGLVVLAHQALLLAPVLVQSGAPGAPGATGAHAALASLRFHVPAILLQIVGGYAVLRFLARRSGTAVREG